MSRAPIFVTFCFWVLAVTTSWFWLQEAWSKKKVLERVSPRLMFALVLVLAGWAASYEWQQGRSARPPDVGLRFIRGGEPILFVTNQSDAIAREPKWQVALWNMETRDPSPLPIPAKTLDWVKARSDSAPQSVFHPRFLTTRPNTGDRLFGTAIVNCPACPQGKTYILFVKWATAGWYFELKGEHAGRLLVPTDTRQLGIYFDDLERLSSAGPRIDIPPPRAVGQPPGPQ